MEKEKTEALTDENVRRLFAQSADFSVRSVAIGNHTLQVYFIDGLTSGNAISEYVVLPIRALLRGENPKQLYESALHGDIVNAVAKPCQTVCNAANFLLNGFCVVLFEDAGALAFEVKTGEKRGIAPPELERTAKGAKDAFVETNRTNTSLVRRHLRSSALNIFETTVGTVTKTNVSVLWLEGAAEPDVVRKIQTRLCTMDTESFLSPAEVEELLSGSRATAFPMLQYTERTDRFCSELIRGRVGLFVDGIPVGYMLPVTMGTLMQSQEDMEKDYVSASCVRVLRFGALFFSLLLPALYIAMATYHQELIPLPLLRAVIESKQSVPFSTVLEVIGLLAAFELLQESGIHLPQAIGQSVSIIGGIVVGTAAVEASLISPAALIAVSIAGVCGFVLPNRDFADGIRIWRLGLSVLAAMGGLFGVTVGFLMLLIHLSSLDSLGEPYLAPYVQMKDVSILRNRLVIRKEKEKG